MKNKVITLLLLLGLILTITACGQNTQNKIEGASKKEQEAYDAACALLEEGRYGEAIDAFNSIPLVLEVQMKIAEAAGEKKAADADFLIGKWIDVADDRNDFKMDFRKDGHVNFNDTYSFTYSFDGELIYINVNTGYNGTNFLTKTDIDGVTHLTGILFGSEKVDFVPAEYYDKFKPAT